jgi:transcriptional regulator with XRE-family HTH domain
MPWDSFDLVGSDPDALDGFRLIGRLFQRRRHRLGMSQQMLELVSGVDQTVISRLETGRLRGIRWSRLAKVVAALGGIVESDPPPRWWMDGLPPPYL